jgi:serine protease
MKKILTYSIFLFFAACTPEQEIIPNAEGPVLQNKQITVSVPSEDAYESSYVKNAVLDSLEMHGDFNWNRTSIRFIWSGAKVTGLVAIGYRPLGMPDNLENIIHEIDIKKREWKSVHDSIIDAVLKELNSQGNVAEEKDIIYEDDPVLPIIIFKLTDKYSITRLYNLENVRYIEPYGFWPYQQACSSSGCNPSTTTINAADYTNILPACKLPWNYNNVNIPAAWNMATGLGIKLGIIDAGISNVQPLLGTQFNSGYSNSTRTVTVDYTYGSSAYSSCTHGTSMCGLAAGPRNSQNAVTGVAYKSDLSFIRGCDDVVLDSPSELSGVRNALVRMGNDTRLKIISMSVGTPLNSSTLFDGVMYASGKNKMIFAAAGTSFSWTTWWGVIYPAAYSQCIAVTGVKENGNKCSTCHDGSQVKFTIPMERDADKNRHSLSLPFSGYSPTYIGGSSCATATCAGIAALVWSVNPALTKSQVFNCLSQTAQYPVPVTNKGFGNPNAAAAVIMAQGL